MKLVTVVGARPQFIKAAPFSELFRENHEEILVHTGQHYDSNMSDVFFSELNIPKPDYNLNIGSGTHGGQTGRMLEAIESILIQEQPDGVLVYGDTNSTLAGALAASKIHIPVYHVEAGLRSYNKTMPEEINRLLTDHISNLLLCPTQTAVNNLKKEGIKSNVHNVGDIMYDAVLRNLELSKNKYTKDNWLYALGLNESSLALDIGDYYLATIHRAENTDNINNLKTIFKSLELLDKPIIMPLHPRTRKIVKNNTIGTKNIHVIEPVGYLLMLYLISNAYMVITDSGGLQKEAYFLKTPCTTLRSETEWVETLKDQWNILCDINEKDIFKKVNRKLNYDSSTQPKVFGDGNAAKKILMQIIEREGKY